MVQTTPYFDDFLTYYDKAKILQDECNLGGKAYYGMVGDDLMEQVTIYDTVERRYAGFSNMLQDLWLGTKNPKYFKQHYGQQRRANQYDHNHEIWTMHEWIYLFLVHRLTGSGASFESDHGYRNTILPKLAENDTVEQMVEVIKHFPLPMFTSIGNQIPAFPKPNMTQLLSGYQKPGKLYLCVYAPVLAHKLADMLQNQKELHGTKLTIRELVDYMCNYNRDAGINAFHFCFTALAADLADYYPEYVDEKSHMYYGKNAQEAMDLFGVKPKSITKAQYYDKIMEIASNRTGGAPRDLEDVMCDYIRYVENYIPDNREQTYAHLDRKAIWNSSAITNHPKGRQRHLQS